MAVYFKVKVDIFQSCHAYISKLMMLYLKIKLTFDFHYQNIKTYINDNKKRNNFRY